MNAESRCKCIMQVFIAAMFFLSSFKAGAAILSVSTCDQLYAIHKLDGCTESFSNSDGFPISAKTIFYQPKGGGGWSTYSDAKKKSIAEHELVHALGYFISPYTRQYITGDPNTTNTLTFQSDGGQFIDFMRNTDTGLHSTDAFDLMYDEDSFGAPAVISDKDAEVLNIAYRWIDILRGDGRISINSNGGSDGANDRTFDARDFRTIQDGRDEVQIKLLSTSLPIPQPFTFRWDVTLRTVPEPSSISLVFIGIIGAFGVRLRPKRGKVR